MIPKVTFASFHSFDKFAIILKSGKNITKRLMASEL